MADFEPEIFGFTESGVLGIAALKSDGGVYSGERSRSGSLKFISEPLTEPPLTEAEEKRLLEIIFCAPGSGLVTASNSNRAQLDFNTSAKEEKLALALLHYMAENLPPTSPDSQEPLKSMPEGVRVLLVPTQTQSQVREYRKRGVRLFGAAAENTHFQLSLHENDLNAVRVALEERFRELGVTIPESERPAPETPEPRLKEIGVKGLNPGLGPLGMGC